jgi:hypothetical protein
MLGCAKDIFIDTTEVAREYGLLHLLPVIREWQKVPSEAQGQAVNAQPAL